MAVVKPQDYQSQLASWRSALSSGNPGLIATRARELSEAQSRVDTDFHFTVTDFMWRPVGMLGSDLIDASGTDPRNNVGTARIKAKGDSDLIDHFMGCRSTMVGIIMETAGLRFPFYVKVHRYTYEKGAWTGVLECKSIWSILDYLTIWPSWALPIQTQPFSHAVFMWGLCTAIEAMVSESAMRIQAGFTEFINNALSLNPDMRAWWGTVTQALKRDGLSVNTFRKMLRTPIYVKRTNPFLDASPVAIRTVRMETCAQVIRDVTRAYGVDTSMDLWLPGDPQPDKWAKLSQPTYVFSTKDRSQITGPTKTVKDAVIRTVVDLGGSMGVLSSLIKEVKGFDGVFKAPKLGVDFEPPWAILVAPDGGNDGSVISAEIADHTPEGWQHIIGGRSPKWLNDLMNATFSWMLDSLQIILGFTGVPSDLLSGFLNNAFLAFELVQLYSRRDEMGPYHPAIEQFHATASAPYNVETLFGFINAFFDSRGYTAAQVVFRNGEQLALGRDIYKGGLMSLVYHGRTKMVTDYIENILWRVTPTDREVLVQIGDGRKDEAPLAKIQRLITGAMEAIAVLTLSPQNG